MADDLNAKFRQELDEMKAEIRRLQRANPLEAASVTSGRVRFIGGQLRVDSGGSVVIVGTLAIDGTTTVTGTFTVSGPWNLTGNGTISGAVTITGNVTATGTLTQNGPWNMNGAGNIAGNVTQTGNTTMTGNFTVGAGGKITLGSMVLDPTLNGGSIKFAGGPEVYASGGELSLYSGPGSFVTLNGSSGKLNGPGAKWFEVTGSNHVAAGLATKTAAATGLPVGVMHVDGSGNMFRIIA